jgi:hypothetical protein
MSASLQAQDGASSGVQQHSSLNATSMPSTVPPLRDGCAVTGMIDAANNCIALIDPFTQGAPSGWCVSRNQGIGVTPQSDRPRHLALHGSATKDGPRELLAAGFPELPDPSHGERQAPKPDLASDQKILQAAIQMEPHGQAPPARFSGKTLTGRVPLFRGARCEWGKVTPSAGWCGGGTGSPPRARSFCDAARRGWQRSEGFSPSEHAMTSSLIGRCA